MGWVGGGGGGGQYGRMQKEEKGGSGHCYPNDASVQMSSLSIYTGDVSRLSETQILSTMRDPKV